MHEFSLFSIAKHDSNTENFIRRKNIYFIIFVPILFVCSYYSTQKCISIQPANIINKFIILKISLLCFCFIYDQTTVSRPIIIPWHIIVSKKLDLSIILMKYLNLTCENIIVHDFAAEMMFCFIYDQTVALYHFKKTRFINYSIEN